MTIYSLWKLSMVHSRICHLAELFPPLLEWESTCTAILREFWNVHLLLFFITLTVAFYMWLTNPQDMKVIRSWINLVSKNTYLISSSLLLHPELWTHILPFPEDLCGVCWCNCILSSTCSTLLSVTMGGQQNNMRWLKNKKPTRCHLLFYCASYRLNMFRALLCPSSGARDYNVDYHVGCFVLGLL